MTVLDIHGTHPDLALSASGLLAELNDLGVLTAADVHVARRLGALGDEADEDVLVAAALATRAVRHGSVCVELAAVAELVAGALEDQQDHPEEAPEAPDGPWQDPAGWADRVAASPLVAAGALRLEHGLVYLDRHHRQEKQVVDDLRTRAAQPAPDVDRAALTEALDRIFPTEFAEQRAAAEKAALRWTTVITGGPGTGKTTTVAGLLAAIAAVSDRPLSIALAAPTGKAAARLAESVEEGMQRLGPADADRIRDVPSSTLHRLLGWVPDNQTRFAHHRGNQLSQDIVVVDEASMLSLTMTARLLEAVRPDTRLILVGDPGQLTSVDAGAVLADLVEGYAGTADTPVVRLTTSHRFGVEIDALAGAMREGDADRVMELLRAGGGSVEFAETDDPATALRAPVLEAGRKVWQHAAAGDAAAAIAALDGHRLLCAHREGPYGVAHWNGVVERWLSEATGLPVWSEWYVGRPLLVRSNDARLGINNGETGVVVRTGDGRLRAHIAAGQGPLDFAPTRLGDVETMYAMTIHKSQGSQAEEVTVLLPEQGSRLLTRELFYTALTRARGRVRVVGTEDGVRAAVAQRTTRATGLRQRLAADDA